MIYVNDERFKLANQQYYDLVQSEKYGVSLNVVFMEHDSDGRNLFPIDDFVNENIKSDFIFVMTQHDFVCMDNVLAAMHSTDDLQVGEMFCIKDDQSTKNRARLTRKGKTTSTAEAKQNYTIFEEYQARV